MKKINIAIDGPSGAGKSSVSTEVAKRLGYTFINTGSFYRAVAYNAIELNIEVDNQQAVVESLQTLDSNAIEIDDKEQIFLRKKIFQLILEQTKFPN
nr:(d)CMP kinase [Mycoplasmopsis columbina]